MIPFHHSVLFLESVYYTIFLFSGSTTTWISNTTQQFNTKYLHTSSSYILLSVHLIIKRCVLSHQSILQKEVDDQLTVFRDPHMLHCFQERIRRANKKKVPFFSNQKLVVLVQLFVSNQQNVFKCEFRNGRKSDGKSWGSKPKRNASSIQ